jgi:protein-tyrosine kinase
MVNIIKITPGKPEQAKNDAHKVASLNIIERAVGKSEKDGAANANGQPRLPAEKTRSYSSLLDLSIFRRLGGTTTSEKTSQIAEEFRLIKRPVLANAFNQGAGYIKNGNLIMVTSALPGEGKSFCAINLALSIAMEMDHTVLLVDGDVARPSISTYLGIKEQRGLLDVLVDDQLELADVMRKSNIPKLSIVPAGKKRKNSTELLASQVMNKLLGDMAQRYQDRIIIFDSPPLLLTSEAHVLAAHMGQIIVVVEAETTPQKAVIEALRQIESCEVINLVFNKARYSAGHGYYGTY